MSYTGSKAAQGKGTTISIGTTPVVVGEVTKLSQKGRKNPIVKTTNLQSMAEEKQGTLIDQGQWDLEGNRIGGDAGQIAMDAALSSGLPVAFTVQTPVNSLAGQTTTGDKFAFSAIVTDLAYEGFEPTKLQTFKAMLEVTGAITFTAGT